MHIRKVLIAILLSSIILNGCAVTGSVNDKTKNKKSDEINFDDLRPYEVGHTSQLGYSTNLMQFNTDRDAYVLIYNMSDKDARFYFRMYGNIIEDIEGQYDIPAGFGEDGKFNYNYTCIKLKLVDGYFDKIVNRDYSNKITFKKWVLTDENGNSTDFSSQSKEWREDNVIENELYIPLQVEIMDPEKYLDKIDAKAKEAGLEFKSRIDKLTEEIAKKIVEKDIDILMKQSKYANFNRDMLEEIYVRDTMINVNDALNI